MRVSFGFEGLELSGQLLGRRAELCDSALRLCAALLGPAAAGTAAGADGGGGVGGCQGAQGGSGTGVSVTSLSAIRAERSRRKEERRVARRAGAAEGGGAALERLLGTYGLDGALQAAAEQQWRHIEQQAAAGGARPAGGGAMAQRHALPEGTLREVFETHETVSVPPPARTEAARAAALARPRAQVGLLEPLVQRVLRGVERLNPMQTAVHTCALRSSENFLVCAPTGAGKTNVALMAICQQLLAAQRAGGGAVDLSAVKVRCRRGLGGCGGRRGGGGLRPPLGAGVPQCAGGSRARAVRPARFSRAHSAAALPPSRRPHARCRAPRNGASVPLPLRLSTLRR